MMTKNNSVHKQMILLALLLQKSVRFKDETDLISFFFFFHLAQLTNENNFKCYFCLLIGFQLPSKSSLMEIGT